MVLVATQPHIANDLPQQRADNILGTMVGNYDDAAVRMCKGIVAPLAALPDESALLCDTPEPPVWHDAELAHAGTRIFQVPTNSGASALERLVAR